MYLFPPIGGIVAALVQYSLGHRKCMMTANAVHFLSVVILWYTDNPESLYAVTALMGFNIGFVNNVTISYCGEVCEPKLRGILSSVINMFYFAGDLFITTFYATTADWKLSVLFTVIIPMANVAFMFKASTHFSIANVCHGAVLLPRRQKSKSPLKIRNH